MHQTPFPLCRQATLRSIQSVSLFSAAAANYCKHATCAGKAKKPLSSFALFLHDYSVAPYTSLFTPFYFLLPTTTACMQRAPKKAKRKNNRLSYM
jgi:hypothetical protein